MGLELIDVVPPAKRQKEKRDHLEQGKALLALKLVQPQNLFPRGRVVKLLQVGLQLPAAAAASKRLPRNESRVMKSEAMSSQDKIA